MRGIRDVMYSCAVYFQCRLYVMASFAYCYKNIMFVVCDNFPDAARLWSGYQAWLTRRACNSRTAGAVLNEIRPGGRMKSCPVGRMKSGMLPDEIPLRGMKSRCCAPGWMEWQAGGVFFCGREPVAPLRGAQ